MCCSVLSSNRQYDTGSVCLVLCQFEVKRLLLFPSMRACLSVQDPLVSVFLPSLKLWPGKEIFYLAETVIAKAFPWAIRGSSMPLAWSTDMQCNTSNIKDKHGAFDTHATAVAGFASPDVSVLRRFSPLSIPSKW